MRAGKMRHRVTIRTFTTSRSPSGQVIEQWEDGATIWAEVKGISGREIIASGREIAESTVRVWMRYRADITAANKLNVLTGPFAGSTLNISGPPIPDTDMTHLEILCKQGVEQ